MFSKTPSDNVEAKKRTDTAEVYIAIGGNIGTLAQLEERFDAAGTELEREIGEARYSRLYESSAEGVVGFQPNFLNGVIAFQTSQKPEDVLTVLERVERAFGRVNKGDKQPRTLDLDLLSWGDLVLKRDGLVLPHPRAHLRAFVTVPWCDVAPKDFEIPKQGSLHELVPELPNGMRLYSEFRFLNNSL